MARKSKGRQKVEMAKMNNESNLQVTFSKRRAGLFKKASELSTLCGAKIAIIVFSPGQKVFSFGHPFVQTVLERFVSGNPPQAASGTMKLIEAHRNTSVRELNMQLTQVLNQLEIEKKRGEELNHMKKANKNQCWWMARKNDMSLTQLQQLKASLDEQKKNVAKQAEKIAQDKEEAARKRGKELKQRRKGLMKELWYTRSMDKFNLEEHEVLDAGMKALWNDVAELAKKLKKEQDPAMKALTTLPMPSMPCNPTHEYAPSSTNSTPPLSSFCNLDSGSPNIMMMDNPLNDSSIALDPIDDLKAMPRDLFNNLVMIELDDPIAALNAGDNPDIISDAFGNQIATMDINLSNDPNIGPNEFFNPSTMPHAPNDPISTTSYALNMICIVPDDSNLDSVFDGFTLEMLFADPLDDENFIVDNPNEAANGDNLKTMPPPLAGNVLGSGQGF
ncbi:MADS-box transcription factor 6-like [Carica papaya]|uniref:MADS-box transcription factor 6-like n=1 Tax=Carica papaya TaxID=3649 RepID=UPI000B8CACED|nr:MADS-box transcription factor 6-like [Carica papaya]